MITLDGAAVRGALDLAALTDALERGFASDVQVPERHHHKVELADVSGRAGGDATLLLMPAWTSGGYLGVKVATVFPDNPHRGLETVQASYLLLSGSTGVPLALLDGAELTALRTAAASVLAARFLARSDARRLLIVGTGRLAPCFAAAYASDRSLSRIGVWGRRRERAESVVEGLVSDGYPAEVESSLESAVRSADIVSCVTLATEPLIHGEWLRPGVHLDLVGGFRPDMREADDVAVARAEVFVDTRGALREAGDLAVPVERGVLRREELRGDLFDLCRRRHPGRRSDAEITLFKSVGYALEDLVAAVEVYEHVAGWRAS